MERRLAKREIGESSRGSWSADQRGQARPTRSSVQNFRGDLLQAFVAEEERRARRRENSESRRVIENMSRNGYQT